MLEYVYEQLETGFVLLPFLESLHAVGDVDQGTDDILDASVGGKPGNCIYRNPYPFPSPGVENAHERIQYRFAGLDRERDRMGSCGKRRSVFVDYIPVGIERCLAFQLVLGQSEQLEGLRIAQGDFGIRSLQKHPDLDIPDHGLEVLLAFPQFVFGPPALGDVHPDAGKIAPAVDGQRHSVGADEQLLAAFDEQMGFNLAEAVLEHFFHRCGDAYGIVALEPVCERHVRQFLGIVAGHFLVLFVPSDEPAVFVIHVEIAGNAFEQGLVETDFVVESLFLGAQVFGIDGKNLVRGLQLFQ